MFMQMTEASVQFYEKFDSFRIMAIKKPFKLGLMNCKILKKKNVKTIFIPKIRIQLTIIQ